MPPAAAEATCPRCHQPFHCGVADTTPCACSTVALPPATLAALRERYAGCLCLSCLKAIAAQPARVSSDGPGLGPVHTTGRDPFP